MTDANHPVYLCKSLIEKLLKRDEKSAIILECTKSNFLKTFAEALGNETNGKIDMLSVANGVDPETALKDLGKVNHAELRVQFTTSSEQKSTNAPVKNQLRPE